MTEGVREMLEARPAETLDDDAVEAAGRAFIAEHRPTSLLGRLADPRGGGEHGRLPRSDQASATTGAAVRVDGGVLRSIG